MRSGSRKISAVNLHMSALSGRAWSCSGKLSSVTRGALISDIHRAPAKCTCSVWTNYACVGNYPFIQLCSSPSPGPAAPEAPPEPAALTRPRSLFLHVAAAQLQLSVHPSFCFLQPHCLFPQRPLHEHCGGKRDPMVRMLLKCSSSHQLWHLKGRDTPKLPQKCFAASPTSRNNSLPNIQNKILPPTDPPSGSIG